MAQGVLVEGPVGELDKELVRLLKVLSSLKQRDLFNRCVPVGKWAPHVKFLYSRIIIEEAMAVDLWAIPEIDLLTHRALADVCGCHDCSSGNLGLRKLPVVWESHDLLAQVAGQLSDLPRVNVVFFIVEAKDSLESIQKDQR